MVCFVPSASIFLYKMVSVCVFSQPIQETIIKFVMSTSIFEEISSAVSYAFVSTESPVFSLCKDNPTNILFLLQQHQYLRHDMDSNVWLVSRWSICCLEMPSHPTRSAGGRLSSPSVFYQHFSLFIKAHLIYQAKFLSFVDLVGVVYTFPKIMEVLLGHNKDCKQGKEIQNLYPPDHLHCIFNWCYFFQRFAGWFFANPLGTSQRLVFQCD